MANKWYRNTGRDIDVVLSSKAVVIRNLKGYKFPEKMDIDEKDEVISKVEGALSGTGLRKISLDGISNAERDDLIDGQLFSNRSMFESRECKAILTNDDMSLSVVINDNDHIKIRAQASGYTNSVYKRCEDIAVKLERELDVAFSNKYGYLASTIANTGMGLKLIFTVAIPGIARTGDGLKILTQKVKSQDWSIRPFLSSNQSVKGDIFVVSSNAALGLDEATVLMSADRLIKEIIKIENLCRENLRKNQIDLIENNYYRSYGTLYYSKMIDPLEALDLLGWMRLYNGYQNKSEVDISWEDINAITSQMIWSMYPQLFDDHWKWDRKLLAIKVGEILKNKGGK
ncbi:MAG: hypothetical protein J6Z43_11450 [Clostridiales bacterium]|nr:hypothetical protein [Clostridiales bacterium]